jgi:hypothetical protein
LVLLLLLASSACGEPTPLRLIRTGNLPELSAESATDVPIIAMIASRSEQMSFLNAANPDAWIEAYWARNDPSPGTPGNELRDVLRQRMQYLSRRFPERDLTELEDPWPIFLLKGPWESARHNLTPEFSFWLDYEVPSRQRIPSAEEAQRGSFFEFPTLDRAWDHLQDPLLAWQERLVALRSIAWYELPTVAERLLALPPDVSGKLQPEWDDLLLVLARRMAYQGDEDMPRRLATLAAIGEPATTILRKSASVSYEAIEFHADVRRARKSFARIRRPLFQSPHPAIWTEPDSLLRRLVRDYPMPENLTGWDWRGDLSLSHGPPAWINPDLPMATYIYGLPKYLWVSRHAAGRVEARPLRNPLDDFRRRLWRPNEVGAVQEDLAVVLGIIEAAEGDIRVTGDLLEATAALIRQRTYAMEVPEGGRFFPLYAGATIFPALRGRAEVLLTLGVRCSDVESQTEQGVPVANLNTSCVLLDPSFRESERYLHEGDFTLLSTGTEERAQFLVDTFELKAEAGRHLYYLSALAPSRDSSAGYLLEARIPEPGSGKGPVLSTLLLAAEVSEDRRPGGVQRFGTRIVPYPGRGLYYEEPLWLYFEIQNLQESEFGDRSWEESYFIVPDAKGAGVVRIQAGGALSTIRSRVRRSFLLDLREIGGTYEGPIYLLVLIRDTESGLYGIAAAHLDLAYR